MPRLVFTPEAPCVVCGLDRPHGFIRCAWRDRRLTRETGLDVYGRMFLRKTPPGQVLSLDGRDRRG